MTRKEMKDKAKGQLKGNWRWAVLVVLINILVLAGLEYLGGKLGKSLCATTYVAERKLKLPKQ